MSADTKSTTKPQLHHFAKICNFRDVSTFVDGIKPGAFFRSASAEKATKEDLSVLLNKHKIRTMVDLRSDRERQMDDRSSVVYSSFSVVNTVRQGRSLNGRKIYQMQFIGASFITRLLTDAPISTSLKASSYLARREPEKATLLLVSSLNSKGLLNLYNMFLENCKSQIAEVLQCFLEPTNYPIHLYCNLGKDRTGLITALVLSCLGLSREEICADYSHSNEVDLSGSMAEALGQAGVDQHFLSAPPEVMEKTLEYLDLKYGSVSAYLCRIGFDKHMQAQLRSLLSCGGEVPVSSATDRKAVMRKLSKSSPDFFPPPTPSKEISLDLAAMSLSAKGSEEAAAGSSSSVEDDDLVVKESSGTDEEVVSLRKPNANPPHRTRSTRHRITKGYSVQHLPTPPLSLSTSLTGGYLTHRPSLPATVHMSASPAPAPAASLLKQSSAEKSALKSSSAGLLHERGGSHREGNGGNRSVRFAAEEPKRNLMPAAAGGRFTSGSPLPARPPGPPPGLLKKGESQQKFRIEELSAFSTRPFSSNS